MTLKGQMVDVHIERTSPCRYRVLSRSLTRVERRGTVEVQIGLERHAIAELKTPTIPITEIEQSAFCTTDDELSSRTLEDEFSVGVRWQKLPIEYMRTSPEELDANINEARAKLGSRLVVLGHHYQRDEVIKFADFQGTRSSSRSSPHPRRPQNSSSSVAFTSWPRQRTY